MTNKLLSSTFLKSWIIFFYFFSLNLFAHKPTFIAVINLFLQNLNFYACEKFKKILKLVKNIIDEYASQFASVRFFA